MQRRVGNLKVEDIGRERQLLIGRYGKGKKDRVIPLSATITQGLESYMKGKAKNISLFGP